MLILNRMKLDGILWMELGTLFVFLLFPLFLILNKYMFNPVLSFWMGTGKWWVSRPRLRHIWQLNSRRFDQRHFCRCIRWRWTYSQKRQIKRQFTVQLLLCTHWLDMDDCVWMLSRWLEMSPGLLGGSTHYWESLLPNWHGSYSLSLDLDGNTHWCDRICTII